MTGADFGGVDIDLLADYIGGALDGTPEESAVAARIAEDPAWQAAYASLGEYMSFVALELGRLAPEPMPTEVADRLDVLLTGPAPLESEPSTRAAQGEIGPVAAQGEPGPTADAEPVATGLTKPPVRHLRLVRGDASDEGTRDDQERDGHAQPGGDGSRAGAGDGRGVVRDAGDEDVAGGDGAHGVPGKTRPGRRLRWAAPIAVAAGLVAFVGFGLDYLAGRETHSASTDSAAGSAVSGRKGAAPQYAAAQPTQASGTDYTHATLGIAPVQPLSASERSPGTPGRKSAQMAGDVDAALQRLTAPSVLADCLAAIEEANAGGPLSVAGIDFARFAGAPAVIVRFSASNGQWAWASGPDCGIRPGDPATLDKVPVG